MTSSKNTINVLDEHSIKVTKSINAGYAEINIAYDNITAGADNSATNASTNISTDTSSNVLNANENKISILGQNNTLNDLNVGAAGININHGDITAGTANANTGFFAFSDATVNTNANANANAIKLNTNINTISILSQNNIFNDLKVGDTGINISYGNITAGTANSDSTSFTAANAKADAQANVVDNELNANENEISILGNNNIFNDLNIGDAEINLSYGNITAGIANANSPTPTGNAPTEVDINAFNNRLNADANKISISGQNNTLNNITAGHAGINIKFGDITGGKTIVNGETSFADASLTIDASDTALSASNNSISLEGSSTINGSLYAGYIDFNIDYGAIKKGDGSDVTPDINLTGTKAFATNNTMTIEGSHDVTNLDASIYGGYLSANAEHQPESYDVFTGNTLNYNNRTPIKIGALGNFQTYNFSLNPELANTDTALITAKNVNLGSNKSNTSADSVVASDIYVVGIQSGKPVATDSKFILIQADKDQLTGVGQGHASKGVAQQGISLLYDVETQIDQEKDQVIAIINTGHNQEPSVNPQLKAL